MFRRTVSTTVHFLVSSIVFAFLSPAVAEELVISLPDKTLLPGEPVAVELTVKFDKPLRIDGDDPDATLAQFAKVPRLIHAQLCDEHDLVVRETYLLGGEFAQPSDSCTQLSRTDLVMWALGTNPDSPSPELAPGRYRLVVVDKTHDVQSNEHWIEIVNPTSKEQRAAESFRLSLPSGLYLIFEDDGGDTAIGQFEHLVEQYPDTIYGKYAAMTLALARYKATFAEHNMHGGAAVWGPVAQELAAVESLIPGPNPVRERVLLRLAIARTWAGDLPAAEQAATKLKNSFPHGNLRNKTDQLLQELQDKKRERSTAGLANE